MHLAIDPGADTGWALFDSGPARVLLACGLGDPRHCPRHAASALRGVLIEHPFVYPRGQTKNPNDIVKLAINAGEWGGRYKQWTDVTYVLPFQWKGAVPKGVHHQRILAKLSEDEREIVRNARASWSVGSGVGERISRLHETRPVPKGKLHNVLDAVGLGLYQVGR